MIELFTGPGVSDAARADLKKEMTKKGVRRSIMDGVLSKLLGASIVNGNPQSHEGSEDGDAAMTKREYIPPSLMLQGKLPHSQGNSQAGFAPSRSTNYDMHKREPSKSSSRPSSRTTNHTDIANSSPPALNAFSASTANEFPEVQTVYVSSHAQTLSIIQFTNSRSLLVVISRMSFLPWQNLLK